jgi:hypothetical protein
MTQYLNPKLRAGFTPESAAAVYVDRQITHLNDRVEVPAHLVNGDKLQIGVIPAGATLIPDLSTVRIPVIDTNGAPTATGTIGTPDRSNSLAVTQTLSAPVYLRGYDLNYNGQDTDTTIYGSADSDIQILLTLTAAVATQAITGRIVCDFAFRAFNPLLDVPTGNSN